MQRDDDESAIEDARAAIVGLRDFPLITRTIALAATILDNDPRAPSAIAYLIAVTKVLAKRLPPEQQTAVTWYLNEAAAELEARWN